MYYWNGGRNCSVLSHHSEFDAFNELQLTILAVLLAYIIILNLSGVFITIGSAQLRGCCFSMQLSASYVGNILGASSLFGNDLYYLPQKIPPICQEGRDGFGLLYFGMAINMTILMLNTKYRYERITSVQQSHQLPPIRTKDIVVKSWLPTLLVSTGICAIAVYIQLRVIDYQFLISMGICIVPLGSSITWNVISSRQLLRGRRSSKAVNSDSIQILNRATFIINTIIFVHILFLILCSISIVISLSYYQHNSVTIVTSWLLRLLYFMLFTIEAHVYLAKVKTARDAVKKKLFMCLNLRQGKGTINDKRCEVNGGFECDPETA